MLQKQFKAQAAIEFLSTYAWQLVLIAVFLGSVYFFLSIPQQSLPNRCSFAYGISCIGINIGTSSVSGTIVDLYLANSQQYSLIGNTIATVVTNAYGTSNAMCLPSNVLTSGIILCDITMTNTIPTSFIGQSLYGSIYLNSSVCLNGNITNCATSQHVSYLGNFTTAVSADINPIPVSILLTYSPKPPLHNSKTQLTAIVKVFGHVANGATVTYTISSIGSAQLTKPYALSSVNGSATTYLTDSLPESVTVVASFAGATSSNSFTLT